MTVAYNAVKVLPRQIDALLQQSHPLNEIVIVDNASSDGTSAMLATRYPQVTLLQMPRNLGQAGGWSVGLSYAALRKQHDWIWTFDYDSVPAPNALEALLSGIRQLGSTEAEIGMVAPIPVHSETGTCYLPFLWRDGFVKPSADEACQPAWFADVVIASGTLVRRKVVDQIGLPRADFFMDLADFEYSLRARAHGYKIAVISQVEISHEIGTTREVGLLGYTRPWISQPPFREYYVSRNLTYLAWQLYPSLSTKLFLARRLAARFAGVLLFSPNGFACAISLIRGFGDGLRGRMGIRTTKTLEYSGTRDEPLDPLEKTESAHQ